MNKTIIVLTLLIYALAATAVGYAEGWQIYTNKTQGYTIEYPANGTLSLLSSVENLRSGFYLNPLQPVDDVLGLPEFAGAKINPSSLVKMSFSSSQYLILLTVDHIPVNTPLPGMQTTFIGHSTFYRQHSQDAGMCHEYDYYTYILPHARRYYVFIFLLTTTGCASTAHSNPNPGDYEHILSTFKFSVHDKI